MNHGGEVHAPAQRRAFAWTGFLLRLRQVAQEGQIPCRAPARPFLTPPCPLAIVNPRTPFPTRNTMTPAEREAYRQQLVTLRDRLGGDVSHLQGEALRSGDESPGNLSH